jgi:hypothetical protein
MCTGLAPGRIATASVPLRGRLCWTRPAFGRARSLSSATIGDSAANEARNGMGRIKARAVEDMREFVVDGRTVKVMSRLADNNQLARLFALESNATGSDASPLIDDGEADVMRRRIDAKPRKGRPLRLLGSMPDCGRAGRAARVLAARRA